MAFSPNDFHFHEWLSKTNFSFLSSTSVPFELMQTASTLGYKSICINDFDGVYGIARCFNDLKHIKQQEDSELKLHYGAEIHLFQDHDAPLLKQVTISLQVLNAQGYQNLCRLLSLSHVESKNQAYLSLEKLLQQDLKGIFAIIPMRGGLEYFLKNSHLLAQLKSILPVYLAVTKTYHQISDRLIAKAYELSRYMDLQSKINFQL